MLRVSQIAGWSVVVIASPHRWLNTLLQTTGRRVGVVDSRKRTVTVTKPLQAEPSAAVAANLMPSRTPAVNIPSPSNRQIGFAGICRLSSRTVQRPHHFEMEAIRAMAKQAALESFDSSGHSKISSARSSEITPPTGEIIDFPREFAHSSAPIGGTRVCQPIRY